MDTSTTSANDQPGIESIPVDALTLERDADREFIYTRSAPQEGLIASIREKGILTPLVLSKEGKLIAGVHRLLAAKALGLSSVPAMRTTNNGDAFISGLWENLGHRSFSALETGELLSRLEGVGRIDTATIATTYLPALGLASSESLLAKYVALSRLEDTTKTLATQGKLRDHHLFLLSKCDVATAHVLTRIFSDLRPSAGESQSLRDLLQELSIRENTPVADVCKRDDIQEILQADDAPRLRVQKLRGLLRRLTLPQLSRWETLARQIATDAGLTGAIQVTFPPDMSQDHVDLRFRVKDTGQFQRISAQLNLESSRMAIQRILSILRGEEA